MKKYIAVVIVLLTISVLFSACANSKRSDELEYVKAELVGGQYIGSGELFVNTYNFRGDGTYLKVNTNILLGTDTTYGTYEITAEAIVLCNQYGEYLNWTYTYNSNTGKLTLYDENRVVYTKSSQCYSKPSPLGDGLLRKKEKPSRLGEKS